MMIIKKPYFNLGILFLLILFSCEGGKKMRNHNMASLYNPKFSSMRPDMLVYHNADTTSTVFVRIPNYDLLYDKKTTDDFTARAKVSYQLYDSFQGSNLLDSGSFLIQDTKRIDSTFIQFQFDIIAKRGKRYVMEAQFQDLNRKKIKGQYLEVDKYNTKNRQFFLPKDEQDRIIYQSACKTGTKVYLEYAGADTLNEIFLSRYSSDFPIAAPPFSVNNEKPYETKLEEQFVLKPGKDGRYEVAIEDLGLYFVQLDSTVKSGFTFQNFGSNYPELGTVKELVTPLRFITTKKEYNELTGEISKDKLDAFWLKSNPVGSRAKELLFNYYTRVELANRYFTSHVEGWKTDRGMIYTVFGPPNVIYKTSYSENWIYGEENNFMSLNFHFRRVNNYFSPNDFELNRSTIYKSSYYKAVDSWRQGRILASS